MPDLVAIMEADIPTQRHVPKAARAAWAQCLARALCEAASENTSAAWTRLLLLPKAVLCPPPRGGTARRDHTAQFTLRRCRRWLAGERAGLWQAPARRERWREADGPEAAQAHRHRRCCALAGEEELSRACSALVEPEALVIDDEVVAKLRRKHPQAPPARPALASMGPPSRAVVPDLSAESVVRAARAFRRGSAPGPSGLRGDHLREALATAHGDEVAAHLTQAVRLLVAGDMPTDIAPHLAGARLFALIWRRLTPHCSRGDASALGGQVSLRCCEGGRPAPFGSAAAWRGHAAWDRGHHPRCATMARAEHWLCYKGAAQGRL